MKNTFGGNDLKYTGETQRYTYTVLDELGNEIEEWFGYNSIFYGSHDGSCTGDTSPGLGIVFLVDPTDAQVQAACLEEFNLSTPTTGSQYDTLSHYGWMELGSTGWMC